MNNEYYEESLKGYEIFIEENPDRYRGGFTWSISKDDNEIDCGTSFELENAISEAHARINALATT